MKKAILISVILITAGSLVFANGRPETDSQPWTEGHPCYANTQDEVSVTGKLILEENQWAKLEANGKEYLLMYPYGIDLGVDLTSGEEITVEGFARELTTPDGEDYIHLMVNRATIDGKEYILAGPGMHYNGGPLDPRMMGHHNNIPPDRGPKR